MFFLNERFWFGGHEIKLTGDRRQTKQFCFLDADCLVVGESQSSSRRSAGRYPMKPPRPEGVTVKPLIHYIAGTLE